MIGLGLVVVEKIFRRRRRRRRRHLGVDPNKLGFCIKNIEYRYLSSRVCFFWGKKAEGLLKTLARFSKNPKISKFLKFPIENPLVWKLILHPVASCLAY